MIMTLLPMQQILQLTRLRARAYEPSLLPTAASVRDLHIRNFYLDNIPHFGLL